MLCLSVCVQVRLLEIVSGTKIGLEVIECVAIFCRLIVLGNGFLGFVTLEFLSYTWIEKESGFQSCECGYCDSRSGSGMTFFVMVGNDGLLLGG